VSAKKIATNRINLEFNKVVMSDELVIPITTTLKAIKEKNF